MDGFIQDMRQLSVNDMDKGLHRDIIRLDHKLRELYSEIEAKIHTFSIGKGNCLQEEAQRLTSLLGEVDKAIKGIEALVNLVLIENKKLPDYT